MPIVSLAALTILDAGPAGQIRAAAAAGFTHVGLRLQPLLATDTEVAGHPEREAEVARLLQETGLRLLEVGVFPVRSGFEMALWEPAVALTARLGGRFLVCPIEACEQPDQIAGVRQVAALAAAHGLEALVEFNPYSGCTTLAAAVSLVEAAGSDDVGLVIDAFHLSRSGGHPRDLAGVDRKLIKLIHFCDAAPYEPGSKSADELRRESRTARMLPGEGSLWLSELLDAVGPEVPLSVEAPSQSLAGLGTEERAGRTFKATMRFLGRSAS
ncbi:MAG: hypothetical protein RLZ98_3562 [Pseudomonadota bacterium]|jgi:sugar phosphate isomerase/epimerase